MHDARETTPKMGIATACSLAAFLATMPFLLPNLDILHRLMVAGPDGMEPFIAINGDMSYLRTAALAAMFTVLGMLFVCLLKTAYGRLTLRFTTIGGALYLVGSVIIIVMVPGAVPDSPWIQLTGVAVGFGCAVLCMAWLMQVHLASYRDVLRWVVPLIAIDASIDGVLLVLPGMPSAVIRLVLTVIGTVGCLVGYRGMRDSSRRVTVPGSNWWDVFGRLDASLIEGAKDFSAPVARTMFFIVTPALVLLLLVVTMDMHHTVFADEFPVEVVGSLLACACAVPLLFTKSDGNAMHVAYRVYLPALAVVVFVAGNFVATDLHGIVIDLGVYAFCMLWCLLMVAMIITMACNMQSLRLPSACLLVLAQCLLSLVSYMKMDAGWLVSYKFSFLMALLAAAVVLLVALPSARIWSLVTSSDALANAADGDAQGPTLEQRCDAVARAYGLTPRETEILRYLGRGHGSAYIAEELVVAESTVRSHVKSIYRKTGISSREQLIACIDQQPVDEPESGSNSKDAK